MTRYNTKWIPKGWGGELIVVNNEHYCGKILHMMKGYKCSLHYHQDKIETFWLESGKIKLLYSDDFDDVVNNTDEKGIYTIGDFSMPVEQKMETEILCVGDKFEIPQKRIHQMIALENSRLFEFSTHDESDDSLKIVKGD